MINSTIKEVSDFYGHTQAFLAILFGLVFQYFLGNKRGLRIVIVITASTLFVALFIAPAIIELLTMFVHIDPSGKVAISIYALSSIVSVELMAIIITAMPKAFGAKLKKMLGVEYDDK